MDFELSSIHVSYPPFFRFTLLFLLVYSVVVVGNQVAALLRQRVVTYGSLTQAMFPLFVGVAATWAACGNVARGYRLSGGGPASSAAGAAEAQLPLIVATISGSLIAVLVLGRRLREGVAREAPLTREIAPFLAIFGLLVISEFVVLHRVQSGVVAGSGAETFATSAAFVSLFSSLVVLLASYRKRSSGVSLGAVTAVLAVSLATLVATWWLLQRWRAIAMGLIPT